MHEGKEIEIRVDEKSSRTENLNFKKFVMTILIVLQISRVSLLQDMLIRCPIQYLKSLKSMNLLRHA
jgi:hypothetical protein